MLLITGPMFAGKKELACRLLGCGREDLHRYAVWDVQELAAKGADLSQLTQELSEWPVVIIAETGCGVVPVSPQLREKRERAGRLACSLAEKAETVIRVCCGLPQVLKGDMPELPHIRKGELSHIPEGELSRLRKGGLSGSAPC